MCLTSSPQDRTAAMLADDFFNGRNVGRRYFQMHFLNENYRFQIQISLKFVPMSPIDNKPALI